jgi:hypothetical protein
MNKMKFPPTKIDIHDGDWTTDEVLTAVYSYEAFREALDHIDNLCAAFAYKSPEDRIIPPSLVTLSAAIHQMCADAMRKAQVRP